MSGMLHRLLESGAKDHRKLWRWTFVSASICGVATVALLGVSGWFITASAGAGLAGLAAAQAFNVLLPSAAIRLCAIARTGCRYAERICGHQAALLTAARLRPALLTGIASMPPERALAVSGGDATTSLVQDVASVEDGLIRRSSALTAITAVVTGTTLAALGSPWAAASTLASLALLVLVQARLGRRLPSLAVDLRNATGRLKDEVSLLAAAAPELACYGMQREALERVEREVQTLEGARHALAVTESRLDPAPHVVMGLAATAAAWLSAPSGAATAAMAALAAAMAIEAAAPWLRSRSRQGAVRDARQRIDTLLGDAAPSRLVGRARMEKPDLEMHSMGSWQHVPPASKMAVTGRSGSGKTTLIESLAGMRTPARGQARMNGVDIADIAVAERREDFAWLPQDAGLLAGSIRDNLAVAAPEATDAQLWNALEDAQLRQRVRAMSQGLDTWIGQDGDKLSGGERRRLALARTYLIDRPWLLLDEPTEGLDAETERKVVDSLARRIEKTGQGVIVVSHRPAVIAACDGVLRVDVARPVPTRAPVHRGEAMTVID